MTAHFIPPHPPRGAGPVPVWRGFFGERARTAVYGWSAQAFERDFIRRKVLGLTVNVPLDPDVVQHVLLDNAANYKKPDLVKTLLSPVIGEGLLLADGELWREQRRIVAASFAPGAIEALRPVFEAEAEAAMARWHANEVRDLAEEATRTTMQVVARALFAGDPRLTSEAATAQITAALGGLAQARFLAVAGLPIIPFTPSAIAGKRGQLFLRATLAEMVEDRLAGRVASDDFLGTLIVALQAHFPPHTARELAIDNAATFYIAGHETTANTLAWTMFLLSEQPELQEDLAADARKALGSEAWGKAPITQSLPRLHALLQESLRLYPPVPRIDRQAAAADRLGDVAIQAGEIISVWPWLLHRHRKLWDDPDAFVADRFLKPGERHRFQYLPFGAGPRVCVGVQFATVEALTLLARWLAEWRLVSFGREVKVSGLVTLRPAGGLPLKLERR